MSDNLTAALVDALADVTGIRKTHTANAGSYSYDYADLGDIIAETRPALAKHGVIVLQSVHDHDGGLAVTTTLAHTSGESRDFGPLPFPAGRDAQATGSAITYHRRYSLLAALGLATEDDDGAAATRSARQPAPAPQGITPAEMLEKIKSHLGNGDDDQAKAAWRHAGPKAVGGLIPDAEQARVLKAVDDFAAGPAEYADGEEPF